MNAREIAMQNGSRVLFGSSSFGSISDLTTNLIERLLSAADSTDRRNTFFELLSR